MITPADVSVRRVEFVPIRKSSYITPARFLGEIGDPLVPFAEGVLQPAIMHIGFGDGPVTHPAAPAPACEIRTGKHGVVVLFETPRADFLVGACEPRGSTIRGG